MSEFEQIIEQVFQQIIADNAMTPEQLSEAAGLIANDVMDQVANDMRRELRRKAPSTLRRSTAKPHLRPLVNVNQGRQAAAAIRHPPAAYPCRQRSTWRTRSIRLCALVATSIS
ncbi:hypothetical protein [Tardiphaga sp. 862_B3_N1_1]|uniref:hypothetical protein n=1 Tax=Tardiphaga sp. 862_B3_N1_1 TaxID=3240763 RepID=UPI003F8B3174